MNPLQTMNSAATVAIFTAAVVGISKVLAEASNVNLVFVLDHSDSILFAVFIVLFRIKMHFDDHRYFAHPDRDKGFYRQVGFILAVFSWVVLGLSAYLLSNPQATAMILIIFFSVSTIWIVMHLLEIGFDVQKRKSERLTAVLRHKWVITNAIYIIMLALYGLGATVTLGLWEQKFDISKWLFVLIMLIVLLYDWAISGPFPIDKQA